LPEAVKVMARIQLGAKLEDKDVGDIVSFLASLTGPLPADFATSPVLPAGPGPPAARPGKTPAPFPRPAPNPPAPPPEGDVVNGAAHDRLGALARLRAAVGDNEDAGVVVGHGQPSVVLRLGGVAQRYRYGAAQAHLAGGL